MDSIQKAIEKAAVNLQVNLSRFDLLKDANVTKAISTIREKNAASRIMKLPQNVQLDIFGRLNKKQQAAIASASKTMRKMHHPVLNKIHNESLSLGIVYTYSKFLENLTKVMRKGERLVISFLNPKKREKPTSGMWLMSELNKVIVVYDKTTERQLKYVSNPQNGKEYAEGFDDLEELMELLVDEELMKHAYTSRKFLGTFTHSIFAMDGEVGSDRVAVFEKVFRESLIAPIIKMQEKAGVKLTKTPLRWSLDDPSTMVVKEQYLGSESSIDVHMSYGTIDQPVHVGYLFVMQPQTSPGSWWLDSPRYDSFARKPYIKKFINNNAA